MIIFKKLNSYIDTTKDFFLKIFITISLITPAMAADDPFDTTTIIGAGADKLTVMGKLAFIFKNIFTLIIFTLVAIVFIWAIIRVARVLYDARKEEDYSSFLKDAGLSVAVIIITLLVGGFAFTYGIDQLEKLAK